MIVAIHQPNYLPWLGYFHKIAVVDVFVFLDDVQYSKNSYTNRVQVLGSGQARWLTVPVSFSFGDPISGVRASAPDWLDDHCNRLSAYYARAPYFAAVWPRLHEILMSAALDDLALINSHLVKTISAELKLKCRFESSSNLQIEATSGDDRLIEIVSAIDPGAIYLFGRGGAKYQDAEKFREAGIETRFSAFRHPEYRQGNHDFVSGLSVIDALFYLGWEGVSEVLIEAAGAHA